MGIVGIIAEFNPLHNGHEHLIKTAKNDGHTVVCVISGNFVQRGDTAIIPKFSRAAASLEAGADIVLELPIPWSMSTAQNFAIGGVSQLAALNIDTLYFGSECGDVDTLIAVANALKSKDFNKKIKENLSMAKTFAEIRQSVLSSMLGDKADILSSPNDTLAVEYILAADRLGLNLNFKAVKRLGVYHNQETSYNEFASSTFLRKSIIENNKENLQKFMPDYSYRILSNSPISDINKLDIAIISRLKLLKKEDFSNLPDISEGLENLIFSKVKEEFSYSSLLGAIKSKRFTMARIRRIVLSAFLGIDKSFFLKEPPYVRILGFNSNATSVIPLEPIKPIITKVSNINNLDLFSQSVFELENRANDIYALSLDEPKKYVNDFKSKILKK